MTRELSKQAQGVIASFRDIPYYNNKRQDIRFGLRARVGKGSTQEILDEARIYAMQEKVDWQNLSPEMRKKFLVDHKLGIDCSAFAYYVLDAESQARNLGTLSSHLEFPFTNSIFSKLGRALRNRYVENAAVRTFSHPSNSHEIKLGDIQPGDFLARMNPNDPNSRNHMMIVTKVSEVGPHQTIIVAHSEARPEDGKYAHGVRTETLPRETLLAQHSLGDVGVEWGIHRLNWFTPNTVEGF